MTRAAWGWEVDGPAHPPITKASRDDSATPMRSVRTQLVDNASVIPHDLAAAVDEAMAPVGYAWPGGIVLTDVEDERALAVVHMNPLGGMVVPTLESWVSWCTPAGGLLLPDDVPVAPCQEATPWARLHAAAGSKSMIVVATDEHDIVQYVLATERSKTHAPLLAAAVLRTLLDSDALPRSAEDALSDPPRTWSEGWVLDRTQLLEGSVL